MEKHKFDVSQKREFFVPGCLMKREDEKDNVIEGVAIVCNKEAVIYECDSYREIEVIDKSCIREEFVKEQDIKINALHKRQLTFGRTGANLSVDVREDALAFRCTGTSEKFKETCALINDGVYTGCSFEFYPKNYEIMERTAADGKKEYVIRHTEFRSIDALTVAMDPVYEQTSVNLRETYLEREAQRAAYSGAPGNSQSEVEKREAEKREADKLTLARESADRQRRLRLLDMETNF